MNVFKLFNFFHGQVIKKTKAKGSGQAWPHATTGAPINGKRAVGLVGLGKDYLTGTKDS